MRPENVRVRAGPYRSAASATGIASVNSSADKASDDAAMARSFSWSVSPFVNRRARRDPPCRDPDPLPSAQFHGARRLLAIVRRQRNSFTDAAWTCRAFRLSDLTHDDAKADNSNCETPRNQRLVRLIFWFRDTRRDLRGLQTAMDIVLQRLRARISSSLDLMLPGEIRLCDLRRLRTTRDSSSDADSKSDEAIAGRPRDGRRRLSLKPFIRADLLSAPAPSCAGHRPTAPQCRTPLPLD